MAEGPGPPRKLFPLWGSEPPSWSGAGGPRAERRGRRTPHLGGGVVHGARRRQGRSGRPQRGRQDQPAASARRREPDAGGHGRPPGRPRLPDPGSPPGRFGRRRHRARPRAVRAGPGRGRPPPREAAHRHRGAPFGPRRRAASPGPRTPSASPAATRPRPRCGGWSPASGWRADRIDTPITVLSGGERRRVELARILFAGSDVLLLDEPTNHLDSDAKQLADGLPARLPRRPARRQPRPRTARRGHHPGAAPRRGPTRRVQGHLLPVPRGPGRATRSV